jgi:hypothetical protein
LTLGIIHTQTYNLTAIAPFFPHRVGTPSHRIAKFKLKQDPALRERAVEFFHHA